MKYLLPFILLLLCGCRALDKKIIQESSVQLNPAIVYYDNHSSQVTVEHYPILYREYWNPGGYSNFVVFVSEDISVPIAQWATYTNTQDTNFLFDITVAPQRFFTLYGTNNETGDSAWVVKSVEPQTPQQ